MRCKIHPLDPGIGVCAVCLHDRLLTLQSSYHSRQLDSVLATPSRRRHDQEQPQAPLPFPRSVSPYVHHRRSVATVGVSSSSPFHSYSNNSHLFYSTPQPSTAGKKKNKSFSVFSMLFKLGSDKPRLQSHDSAADPPKPSSSSSGWFSSWKGGRKNGASSEEAGRSMTRRSIGRVGRGGCRGMSPGNEEGEEGEGEEVYDSSPEKRIPAPTPMRRIRNRHLNGSGRGISGFGVCLSPLVRPAPQRRSQVVAGEMGFSGDLRSSPKFDAYDGVHYQYGHRRWQGSGGAVLDVNRSRKLCDIGRFH